MTFEVKTIEFESCSEWENVSMHRVMGKFAKEAKRYIPTIETITKMDCEEKKAILKFKRAISFNTVCNILSQMNKKYSYIEIEEVEYKPESKRVEVEVK